MAHDEKVKEMKIPILLGMDYHGFNSAIDLTLQPHILIAGSTGSGKSIFESAIIASLVTLLTPKQLHLYIVDPKRVDLTLFDGLPHVRNVIREIGEWYPIINYLYDEVQNRNKFLEKSGCRNIIEYNEKFKSKMAYKVLIIDELADLIEKDKYNREEQKAREEDLDLKAIDAIKRLIQVSRAAGVHIITCTQRTSVDIVTGTVKANFPTRISLRLPTKTDSRTILDENGAENLLDNGDMLVKRSNSDQLERFHACFVKIEDIKEIIEQQEFVKNSLGLIG